MRQEAEFEQAQVVNAAGGNAMPLADRRLIKVEWGQGRL
jgi:hypothetical protein